VAPSRIKLGKHAGVIPGVGLSRTLPPVLPPNFLSRKSILADIAIDRAGLTVISAPAGFGKSSLVAEFLSNSKHSIIWYTTSESDGTTELNAHLLQAIRNVEPNFAQWFSGSENLSSLEFLTKLFSELANIDKHFVLVVDNNRTEIDGDENTVNKILNLLPPNVHAIAIRRATPATSYSSLSSFPNFRIFGVNELKLSKEEISKISHMYGISESDQNAKALLESAQGWPAAVNLIASNLNRGAEGKSVEDIGSYSLEPLNLIVVELLKSLAPQDRNMLERLSLFEEFSAEAAEFILEENFSLTKINNFATEALFLIHTADPLNKFAINPLIRKALQQNSKLSISDQKSIHAKLSQYFESQQDHLKSLKHARESGDAGKYRSLFRESMRDLIATGRGKELIQMSSIVGDASAAGMLKRQTVQLIGYAADFQYENAQSLIAEMNFAARDTPMGPFIAKFNAAVSIYIDFAAGRTEDLEKDYKTVRNEADSQLDLGVADKISILRVMAAKASIYDNSAELVDLLREANEIAGDSNSQLVLYLLSAIEAGALLSQGEFKDALLTANNVIAQAARYGYSGLFGPLDAMYVRARCLLEFSQIEDSQILFEQMRNMANGWSQHIWVYVAESFLARDLALNGKTASALELVRAGR
jgi:ATP/maltotriose-dependent transcriptional regulator MalT